MHLVRDLVHQYLLHPCRQSWGYPYIIIYQGSTSCLYIFLWCACRVPMDSASDVECQSIYRNLLLARGAAQNQNAIVYVRELQHTARCDTFCDFKRMRASFAEVLGPASMERITSFDETEKDERMAEQAVTHYHDWVDRNLQSALSWPNWLGYQLRRCLWSRRAGPPESPCSCVPSARRGP